MCGGERTKPLTKEEALQEQNSIINGISAKKAGPFRTGALLKISQLFCGAAAAATLVTVLVTSNTASASPLTNDSSINTVPTPSLTASQEVRLSAIPYHRVLRMSVSLEPGDLEIAQQGVPGIVAKTFEVMYRDDAPVKYTLISSHVIKAPSDEVTLAGIRTRAAEVLPSRSGYYDRARELEMIATGYAPSEGPGRGYCATGMRAGYGVVAVDPRVIPLGSRLFIRGYGYAIAGDTGGAIKRDRIDLGNTTRREARRVGRERVDVTVLAVAN